MNDALAPFRHPAFRLLFTGRFVAFLGNAIAPVAVAFAVLDLTGSAADVGLVLAARSLALVLLLLLGGVWADRLPRHRVLVTANVVSGATQAVATVLLLTGGAGVGHLAVLEALNGAASAFVFPAAAGLTPQTVPTGLLQPANALLRLGLGAGTIGGAAVGGAVVAAFGPAWGLAVDAATFCLAAVCFAAMRVASTEPLERPDLVRDLRDGWHEFASRTRLWVVVLAFCAMNASLAAGFSTLGPVVADATIGRAAWGLVLAAQSTGMVLGGLASLRLRPARPLVVGVAASLLTAPLLLTLRLRPLALPLLAAALLAGVGIEVFAVLWDTALQQHVPLGALSRVSAYDMLGSVAIVPVGQALAGPLAALVGTRTTILGAALLILLAGVAPLAVPSVRALRRRERDPAPAGDPVTGRSTC